MVHGAATESDMTEQGNVYSPTLFWGQNYANVLCYSADFFFLELSH